MSADSKLTRRGFVRLCAGAATLVSANPALLAQAEVVPRRYRRAQLVNEEQIPLTDRDLKVGETYLFHYPYISTPCFLLNLGKPAEGRWLETQDGRRYRWDGGAGSQRTVVAFSAICAHKMSYPTREVNFINYRHQGAMFRDANERHTERAQVIYCCSEKSVYDPVDGARVLGGPAKQPLAAIVLEQDDRGALQAVGTMGGELFERFFEQFSFRLRLEWLTSDVRRLVEGNTTVVTLSTYCRNQILC